MQKIILILSCTGFLALLACGPLPPSCMGGECEYLQANIEKEHNFVKRRTLYRQAVEVCAGDAALRYRFAYELERSRRYDEALAQYQQAIVLDPAMVKAYCNMGDIYRSQGHYREAIDAYTKGLQLEPDNSRVQRNLEEALRAGGQSK